MRLSKLEPFLAEEKVNSLKKVIKTKHTFGMGVSWDKLTQKITGVSLIVRDLNSLSCFKKFAESLEEKETVEFFDRLPMNVENPDDGLHGNIFALKIDNKLALKQAFYRRLGSTPVSLDGGEWYYYQYERFSPYSFPNLKFPEETGDLFKVENKISFSGKVKGSCLYPIYSNIRTLGKLNIGFEKFFGSYLNSIFDKYSIALDDIQDISKYSSMTVVSVGETKDTIKAYFVDFERLRFILNL